jgi:hypothetical protein
VGLEGDQDVDLYVNYARPVVINQAGFPEADAFSNSELSTESLTLSRSDGRAIPAGKYFIGVYNYGGQVARYGVRVQY